MMIFFKVKYEANLKINNNKTIIYLLNCCKLFILLNATYNLCLLYMDSYYFINFEITNKTIILLINEKNKN
tara:strand:- start:402 stop:614 length:213 start_codon:yes stop_codon:yes gene_type:complete